MPRLDVVSIRMNRIVAAPALLRTAAATAVLLAAFAATTPAAAAPAAQEILISGGTVVTSEGRFAADVRVRDGTIVEIGTALAAGPGARV